MRTLIPADNIQLRVAELGERICAEIPPGPLTIVGVLTGSVVFLADLIRRIPRPLKVGLVQASSYRGAATLPGELQLALEGLPDLTGQHVILLDDIFDTGNTLAALRSEVLARGPELVRTAVLLWKTSRRRVELTPDNFGFEIPDEFVVGYGLDFQGEYRHLPHIAALEPEDIARHAG